MFKINHFETCKISQICLKPLKNEPKSYFPSFVEIIFSKPGLIRN